MSPPRVVVTAFDRILPFHLSVPCAVFGTRIDEAPAPFGLEVCAVEPGPLRADAGFVLQPERGLEALAAADVVVVPSWRDPHEPAPPPLLDALRAAHARGALLVGLCVGAFVLAEAGLLDDRGAATHWRCSEAFRARFPRVRLDAEVLYVDAGDVVTSAGTAAGIDCCLHVARRLRGADVAARIARALVVPPHRQGSQAQYVEQPLAAGSGTGPLARTLEWALAHLDRPLGLDLLAERAAMSRRSFTRHFRRHTGTSVGAWLQAQRLALAQRLLETTALPVERIAERAGFGSALSLRQHFARALRTTPSVYRREFRGD